MTEIIINLQGLSPVDFFGSNHENLSLIRKAFPRMKVASRGNKLMVEGNEEDIEKLSNKVEILIEHLNKYGKLNEKNIEYLLHGTSEDDIEMPDFPNDIIVYGAHGNKIRARTANQKKLVQLALNHDIIFAIGPAGTGKTYTAVALAVQAMKNKEVRKIILTRPAVEAGENLGFLPGDLKEKVDPYLRPLYDALDDMIPGEKLNYYMQNRSIEVAPLAFMRGRTLDHAFIILDEAQNTTVAQIKMFLTRIGPHAKCIITGDLTQIDLPKRQQSGLIIALNLLSNIEGIGVVHLNERDVLRHKLVKRIIKAFANQKDADQ